MTSKYQKYLDVALDAAHKAGAIIRENYGRPHTIDKKGVINLVTEVDKASEDCIFAIIRAAFPEHTIFGEEQGQKDGSDSSFRWIVDPLDGTTNFAQSYPFFCTSIALEHNGQIIVGVVYDAIMDETFSAAAGEGAFLNGKKISVSDNGEIGNALLLHGVPYNIRTCTDLNLDIFREFLLTGRATRRDGSAALDLCYTACGRADGYWELGLSPWDTAAGDLILREAGGKVTDFFGEEHSPFVRDLVSSNGRIHDDMMRIAAKYQDAVRNSPYWVENEARKNR